ncbi:MAG TPA: hypothetical protein VK453_08665 [Micromonosporaceae bacterium]|nr:hypothetical protein [Micromonosporaceae bacterium]
MSVQGILYLIAIILLLLAAMPFSIRRVSLGMLAAAFALTAYAWPQLTGG